MKTEYEELMEQVMRNTAIITELADRVVLRPDDLLVVQMNGLEKANRELRRRMLQIRRREEQRCGNRYS